jgi:hypothetical protein
MGCKDRFTTISDQVEKCAKDFGEFSTRLDCSGLVEHAYDMVGFRFFIGKNAQGQYNFVRDNFRIPGPDGVRFGDLIFFENTYEKIANNDSCDEGITHVGIAYDNREIWIAAEDKEVNFYCSPAYYQTNSFRCIRSKIWTYEAGTGGRPCNRFFGYGSVLYGP